MEYKFNRFHCRVPILTDRLTNSHISTHFLSAGQNLVLSAQLLMCWQISWSAHKKQAGLNMWPMAQDYSSFPCRLGATSLNKTWAPLHETLWHIWRAIPLLMGRMCKFDSSQIRQQQSEPEYQLGRLKVTKEPLKSNKAWPIVLHINTITPQDSNNGRCCFAQGETEAAKPTWPLCGKILYGNSEQ